MPSAVNSHESIVECIDRTYAVDRRRQALSTPDLPLSLFISQ